MARARALNLHPCVILNVLNDEYNVPKDKLMSHMVNI